MAHINFSYKKAIPFVSEQELTQMNDSVAVAHQALHNKTGAGNEYLGWLDLPNTYDQEEFNQIKVSSEKIKQESDVLLVIGIGGSYLGARAAIDMLNHSFSHLLSKDERKAPEIIFVGHHISSTYMQELLDVLQNKDVSINVISKSGTTTEPALAFRIFRNFLEEKYGVDEAKKRIYATTDKEKGIDVDRSSFDFTIK